jgi:hypothetical protein
MNIYSAACRSYCDLYAAGDPHPVSESSLLFCGKDHLFALGAVWHAALLAVLSNIVLSPLNTRELVLLDLTRLLDGLGHMTMALDPSDLWHVSISANKRLIILQLLPLARTLNAATRRGI